MNGIEKLRVRMNVDGGSLSQNKINSTVNYIEHTFQDDPTYQIEGVQIVGENIIYPRIWNYKKDDNLSPTVEIQTRITEEFKRGQVLMLNGEYWLCLKSQRFHGMYWTGKLKQCTHLLYYQNAKTREIESSWAVLERPYSKTLNNGQVITTSEMEFKAMLPFNDSTKKINLDRRLLTGTEYDSFGNEIGSVYQVTGRNGSSQVINGEGFLVLNMEQVQFNKGTDNLDLMIADYIPLDSPTPPVDPDPTLLGCKINGSDKIRIGGSARTYKGVFYLADGITPDDSVSALWAIDIDAAVADKIISAPNGNSIDIACVDDINLEDISFGLQLTDSNGKYVTSELRIKVVAAI